VAEAAAEGELSYTAAQMDACCRLAVNVVKAHSAVADRCVANLHITVWCRL
jgi:hypothetical protein